MCLTKRQSSHGSHQHWMAVHWSQSEQFSRFCALFYISSYIVEKRESGGQWRQCARSRFCYLTIEGLKPKESYEFRVLAENKHGLSEPSEPTQSCEYSCVRNLKFAHAFRPHPRIARETAPVRRYGGLGWHPQLGAPFGILRLLLDDEFPLLVPNEEWRLWWLRRWPHGQQNNGHTGCPE